MSGLKTKGAKACPICGDDTHTLRLDNCKKNIYMRHHRFLTRYHPYRRKKEAFDGKVETRQAPVSLFGKEVYNEVKNINNQFGKTVKLIVDDNRWKKKFILWDLPYWSSLEIRHCLDEMHIVKNICESLVGLLLNIQEKTIDGVKARKDMVQLGIRMELAPVEAEK
jgi:Transposase family tnp2